MKGFKFIGINDCGSTCCPHCGSEGRYIYTWEFNGEVRSAMAGCYKRLTGMIEKSDEDRYFELLSEKQAKGKELNGWDKKIISLVSAIESKKITFDWGWLKIRETLSQRKIYLSKKRY